MLIKKPPPCSSRGRTRCEAARAEAEQQHAPTLMSAPRSGRKKGRRAGCLGMLQYFFSIIDDARAHRPGQSRRGAPGGHLAPVRQSVWLSKPPGCPQILMAAALGAGKLGAVGFGTGCSEDAAKL